MFSQVSVCLHMCGRGCAWQGACMGGAWQLHFILIVFFIKYAHTSIECRIFLHRNNSSFYSINCTSSCLQGFPSCVCCISYSFFVSAIMLTNKVSSKISKWVRNFKEDFIVHTYLFIQKSLANPGGALYQPNFL